MSLSLKCFEISASWSFVKRSSSVLDPKGISSLVNVGGDFKA